MTEYQYILDYAGTLKTLETNPAGWSELGVSFIRNKKYSSVLRTMALSLRFPLNNKGGGLFIKSAYDIDGISANIGITINERSKKTNAFVLLYRGTLDLTPGNCTFEESEKFVECGIQDSMKLQKFVSRDELELNVFNTISVDGEQVDSFASVDEIILTPVDIILSTNASATFEGSTTLTFDHDTLDVVCSLPAIAYNELGDRFTPNTETIYTNSTTENIELKINVFGQYAINVELHDDDAAYLVICFIFYTLTIYDDLGAIVISEQIYGTLLQKPDGESSKSLIVSNSFSKSITQNILPNYYISLRTNYELGGPGDPRAVISQTGSVNISITENSGNVAETSAKAMFVHDTFTRLCQLTTSEQDQTKLFRSTFFGKSTSNFQIYTSDGVGSNDAITSGLLIRKYPDAPLNISVSKLFKSLDAVYCLGLGYDQINERFYVEKKDRFYKPELLMFDLGEVAEFKRYPSTDYFSSILGGYKNDGNYENIQGANEINTARNYSINPPVKEELNVQAEYNFDSVGAEIARRKPYTSYANTDTRFDNNNYIFRTDGVRPVLNSSITGFAGIGKYYNTMLTPRENLIRWSGWLKSILWKTTNGVKYASSAKNITMNYVNQNGLNVSELSDIPKSELINDPYFIPEIYEFKSYINFTMISQLNEDPHGFIRFSFEGIDYEGYIDQITTGEYNRNATFKLLAKAVVTGENFIYENDTENLIFENNIENLIFD